MIPRPGSSLRHILALLALALPAACSGPSEPPDPHAASWSATPHSLVLAVGVPETLAVTFLTSQGDLVDVDYLRWFEWRFQGGAALSMQGLGSFENPQRYLVQAAAPVTGTLIVRVGEVRGCDDPPECLIKHWEQELTDLVIPFQVQPAAARQPRGGATGSGREDLD